MIARKHRFHGYSSLRFVHKSGQSVRGPLLSLRYIVNDRRQTWRLAIIVSRKVSKSAVQRNRIRRRIYELIRQHQASFTKPYDFVIVVFSPQLTEMEPSKLSDAVLELLEKAGVKTAKIPSKQSDQRAIVKTKED